MGEFPYIFIGIFLAFVFASIYGGYKREQKKRLAWQQFAQANGLTFTPSQLLGPPCSVAGNYQDCLLELNTVEKDSGKSRTTCTRLRLRRPRYQRVDLPMAQFPLGQPLNVKAVEDLLLLNPYFRLKGELDIRNRGHDWTHDQPEIETDAKYLQELTDFLSHLIKNYPTLLAFGGEAVTALYNIVKAEDHVLRPVVIQLLHDIANGTTNLLKQHTYRRFCALCLTRCSAHHLRLTWRQSITYYGCRTCGQSREFLSGSLVAVLDRQMEAERAENRTEIRVNWLRRRSLYDFSRVEIVQASDEDVERLAVQVGNDTDERRRPHYARMRCAVAAQCQLSENTLRILERMFGEVEVQQDGRF